MDPDTRAHVHALSDQLPPGQLAAPKTLLESMVDKDFRWKTSLLTSAPTMADFEKL
jgi:hypothetical protein